LDGWARVAVNLQLQRKVQMEAIRVRHRLRLAM
jgi:hypothetical protein